MISPFILGVVMGKSAVLLLILLGFLQYSLWLGKNGIHDYNKVSQEVESALAQNAQLKSRNDRLFAEIDDLNGGQEALDERARSELGMIKPNESFYRIVNDKSQPRR